MKNIIIVSMILMCLIAAKNPDDGFSVTKADVYISEDSKIAYKCKYSELPSGTYYMKTEKGIYRFVKVR